MEIRQLLASALCIPTCETVTPAPAQPQGGVTPFWTNSCNRNERFSLKKPWYCFTAWPVSTSQVILFSIVFYKVTKPKERNATIRFLKLNLKKTSVTNSWTHQLPDICCATELELSSLKKLKRHCCALGCTWFSRVVKVWHLSEECCFELGPI